jgi:hypothetical protein
MENQGKFAQIWQSISDKIQDQSWFQQLKAKWDELDSRAKTVLKYAGLLGSVFLGVSLVGTSLYSVAETKSEIDEKLALIQKIQSSQDELRRLRDVTSRFDGGDAAPWAGFLQEKAQAAGFDPSIVQIASETAVGAKPDAAKSKDAAKGAAAAAPANGPEETIVEVGLKRINVRQLVKYVHEIENGGRTVKVRRLQIDTAPDESGYLDAKVSLSAFRLKP